MKYYVESYANPASPQQVQLIMELLYKNMLVTLALAVIAAYGWYKLDKKLGGKNPVWMFIPILNTIEIFKLGDVNPWNLLWIFVPLIGPFVIIYYSLKALLNITRKAGKPGWYLFLLLVPVVGSLYPFLIIPSETKKEEGQG